MIIANELRKKNIAEYLLYMWQIEDTIRAFDCSLRRIRDEYVSRFDYTEEQKEEEIDCLTIRKNRKRKRSTGSGILSG